MKADFLSLLLLLLLLSAVLPAQTPKHQPICELQIPVIAIADNLQPMVLNAGAFTARLGNVKADVVDANLIPSAPRLLLAIDVSGSQGNSTAVNTTYAGVDSLLRTVPQGTQLGLVLFTEKVIKMVPFSADRRALIAALDDYFHSGAKWWGGTALFDTLLATGQMFREPQFGDSVVVFSDGADNKSSTLRGSLIAALASRGIRVFSIYVPSPDDHGTPEEVRGPYILRSLSEETGGIYLPVEDKTLSRQELLQEISNMADALRETLDLHLQVPAHTRSKKLKLSLAPITKKSMKQNVRLIHPPVRLGCD
jgi:hypothetical protein